MKKLYILFLFCLLMGGLSANSKNKVVGVMLDLLLQDRQHLLEDPENSEEERANKVEISKNTTNKILKLIEDTSYIGFYPSGGFVRKNELIGVNKKETLKFLTLRWNQLNAFQRIFQEEKKYTIPASLNAKPNINNSINTLPSDMIVFSDDALGMIATDFTYLPTYWEKYIIVARYIEESNTFEIIPGRIRAIKKNTDTNQTVTIDDFWADLKRQEGQKYLDITIKVHNFYDCLKAQEEICIIDNAFGVNKPLKEYFVKSKSNLLTDIEMYTMIFDKREVAVKGMLADSYALGKLKDLENTAMSALELNGSIQENTEDEPLMAAPVEQKIDTKEVNWY